MILAMIGYNALSYLMSNEIKLKMAYSTGT